MARYALVIGVAAYNNFRNLEKAVTDAEAIAQLLERQGNFQEVKRLPAKWLKNESRWVVGADKKLTGKELGKELRTFLLEQAVKNEAVIYFAGHGFPVSSCMGVEQGYLATSDCYEDGRNAIPLRDFNTLMVESDLSSLVVMLDCCYAGTLLERQLLEPAFTAFNTKRDYYLITACRGFQKAYEGVEHGVFTGAILKGLAAANADEKGQVSGDRLFDCIASELMGSGQEPIRMGWGRSLTLVQYQPKKTEIVVDETCPYQGLEAFGKEQARFFFGREKVVQLLMEKLGQANFVPIIGASGSGKSSVVRAGLIPHLEKNGWRVLEPILPGDEPFAELKTVLIELFGRTEGREAYSLIRTDGLRPVIERLSGSERLLLVVDQFEEVFTLCPKEEERCQFIELLTQVVEIPASRLAIVTTMRADFLEPCLSYESLTRLIQDEAVYMPPLVGADLEEAIASPAKLQGYRFEKGLLGAILQDVGQEKGCLPLLQFTLTELWEERDKQAHLLTIAKYRQLSGVNGALNRYAENLYKSFTEQQQDWVKRIFLKLVRTGAEAKDTRQRQPKAKLMSIADDSPFDQQALRNTLAQLVQGRLLVTDHDQQGEAGVDLAHEALMESWERFAQWRQEDRELRRLIDRVEDAMREWHKEPKDNNLMMGGLLAQVRARWSELELNLPASTKEFCTRSLAVESEPSKIQDLVSSLGFALRSFKDLNQFLELIPLMATRVTNADGGALILFKPNGQIRLERLHCQESQACQDVRKAIEKATHQVTALSKNGRTDPTNPMSLELIHASLDEHVSQGLGADVQLFGTPVLVKNSERGRLYVFSNDFQYSWTPTRQKLMRLVADQTAVAIANNELTVELRQKERLDRELEIGADIQLRLLPRQCPKIKGVKLAARCKTAKRVGSDYYDFIPIGNHQLQHKEDENVSNRWSLVIGNVMGTGVPGGLLMTMTRGILRTLIPNGISPSGILQDLNRMMCEDLQNSNRFVTLFYSEYDPETQILSYSNAAHNAPLLWQAASDSVMPLDTLGMLIGLEVDSRYDEDQVQLHPGDKIIYYTNGFTDATNQNGDRFDEENLIRAFQWSCQHCNEPGAMLDYLFDQVQLFIGSGNHSRDDMTLISVWVESSDCISVTIPSSKIPK